MILEIEMISVNPETRIIPVNSNDKVASGKSIFVCTFCQVFASSVSAISNHINTEHQDSLLLGTKAEDFVSQLKSLPGENKKNRTKPSRCEKRKYDNESFSHEEKVKIVEPVLAPDGLYWCKTCKRHFNKPRQLVSHRCYVDEDESEQPDKSEEFKLNMNVVNVPWQRMPKRSCKGNKNLNDDNTNQESLHLEKLVEKVYPTKKKDPFHLFSDDKEKLEFENHLKSIDYSFVDPLFTKEKKNPVSKETEKEIRGFIYTCTVCQKMHTSITHIRMHCLTHTDAKPFTCLKCPFQTNSLGTLYYHMRNHTGKMLRCSRCAYTTTKRSHLRDHEDTHSSIPLFCKLCKNSYKNRRSLIVHVKNYHKNSGGKKYVKFLNSKDSNEIISCQSFPKSLASQSNSVEPTQNKLRINLVSQEKVETEKCLKELRKSVNDSSQVQIQDLYSPRVVLTKDPLADIILKTILDQKNSESIEFYDVFKESAQNGSSAPCVSHIESFSSISQLSVSSTSQFNPSETVIEECSKTLEIIGDCLNNQKYALDLNETCIQPNEETFHVQELPSSSTIHENGNELRTDDGLGESNPEENKLFEKCQRAPAYVCCVCSGIYICPSTLKAHLREHINTTKSLIEEAAQGFEKMVEDPNLDAILEDSSDVCIPDDEKELEKLYSSSLDMMWYLPEVSVVLDHDSALFDSMLEDFPDETEILEKV